MFDLTKYLVDLLKFYHIYVSKNENFKRDFISLTFSKYYDPEVFIISFTSIKA